MARLVFIGRMLPGPSADLGSRQVLVCSSRARMVARSLWCDERSQPTKPFPVFARSLCREAL